MPDTNPAFADDVPTAMVYEAFAETASLLIARLAHLHTAASTVAERDRLWAEILAVRDTKRSTPPYDRQQLIEQITAWNQSLALTTGGTGA